MIKLMLVGILSLGLIACESGEDGQAYKSAVYGLDFEYDGSHPEEIEVSPTGVLKPFVIDMADIVEECGQKFYKSEETEDIFTVVEINGNWHAKQVGHYQAYDHLTGGFQTVGYNKRKYVSVGKYVAISLYPVLSEYWDWTRVNYLEDAAHENCMVIIDEVAKDVLAVDLDTETTESIF